jgi:hypothetical protein
VTPPVTKLVVEPGGAVAFAALSSGRIDLAGRNVAVVLSGGSRHGVLRQDYRRQTTTLRGGRCRRGWVVAINLLPASYVIRVEASAFACHGRLAAPAGFA